MLIYQVFGPRVAYIPQFEKCWYISKIFDVNVKSLVYKQGLYNYLAYIPESFFPILFLAYIPDDGIHLVFSQFIIHCEILLMDSLSSISSMEEIILPDNAP